MLFAYCDRNMFREAIYLSKIMRGDFGFSPTNAMCISLLRCAPENMFEELCELFFKEGWLEKDLHTFNFILRHNLKLLRFQFCVKYYQMFLELNFSPSFEMINNLLILSTILNQKDLFVINVNKTKHLDFEEQKRFFWVHLHLKHNQEIEFLRNSVLYDDDVEYNSLHFAHLQLLEIYCKYGTNLSDIFDTISTITSLKFHIPIKRLIFLFRGMLRLEAPLEDFQKYFNRYKNGVYLSSTDERLRFFSTFSEYYFKIGHIEQAFEFFNEFQQLYLLFNSQIDNYSSFSSIYCAVINHYIKKGKTSEILELQNNLPPKKLDIEIANSSLFYHKTQNDFFSFLNFFNLMIANNILPNDLSFSYLFSMIDPQRLDLLSDSFHKFVQIGIDGFQTDSLRSSLLPHLNYEPSQQLILQILSSYNTFRSKDIILFLFDK